MTPRVVVIGGGITGLSLAWTLQEAARQEGRPLSLTVVEAAARAGGHARTERIGGLVIEAGPNGFLNREPETLALVESLGLTARLVSARPEARRRYIVRDGRLCHVPESPASLVTSPALSWRAKLRLLGEPFAPDPPQGDETIHAFATRRIGVEAAEMLVDAAVAGISAGDSRQLSVAAQFPRMVEMEREHGSLLKAMFARKRGPKAGPSKLLAFDGGMGTLTETLAARLGEVVRCGEAAKRVARAATGWRVDLGAGRAMEADEVVLALPARAAAPMVAGLDEPLASAMGSIGYAGIAVVALAYPLADVPRALDGYGYLVTRPEGLTTLGVVWESSLFAGRAPEGMALLRVFMGGSRRPEILAQPEDAVVRLAREELARVMGIRAEPRHTAVFAWPDAIAQYTVGHLDRVRRIRERLETLPGLTACGTSYDGVSFNDAVKSGRSAARALAGRLWARGAQSTRAAEAAAAVGV